MHIQIKIHKRNISLSSAQDIIKLFKLKEINIHCIGLHIYETKNNANTLYRCGFNLARLHGTKLNLRKHQCYLHNNT